MNKKKKKKEIKKYLKTTLTYDPSEPFHVPDRILTYTGEFEFGTIKKYYRYICDKQTERKKMIKNLIGKYNSDSIHNHEVLEVIGCIKPE